MDPCGCDLRIVRSGILLAVVILAVKFIVDCTLLHAVMKYHVNHLECLVGGGVLGALLDRLFHRSQPGVLGSDSPPHPKGGRQTWAASLGDGHRQELSGVLLLGSFLRPGRKDSAEGLPLTPSEKPSLLLHISFFSQFIMIFILMIITVFL
jgi:hypothetical protein